VSLTANDGEVVLSREATPQELKNIRRAIDTDADEITAVTTSESETFRAFVYNRETPGRVEPKAKRNREADIDLVGTYRVSAADGNNTRLSPKYGHTDAPSSARSVVSVSR